MGRASRRHKIRQRKLHVPIAVKRLVEHGYTERQAVAAITELIKRGDIGDHQTRVAIHHKDDGDFEIVDLAS